MPFKLSWKKHSNNNNNTSTEQTPPVPPSPSLPLPPPPPLVQQQLGLGQQLKQLIKQPTTTQNEQPPPLKQQQQNNLHPNSFLNQSNETTKQPQHELTIAILHPALANTNNIQQTIESRLAATGFKIIQQQTINSNNINPLLLTQNLKLILPTTTTSIVYLLSRSRAIQAWKDLVGINPDLPARPGSLSFIFGTHAVWAAEKLEDIYELIRLIWPHSPHLNHPIFNHISLPKEPTQLTPPTPPLTSSNNKTQKRVFRFSQKPPTSTVPMTTGVAISDHRAVAHSQRVVLQEDSHLIIQPTQSEEEEEEETITKHISPRIPNSSFSSISPSVFSHSSGLSSYTPAATTTPATPTIATSTAAAVTTATTTATAAITTTTTTTTITPTTPNPSTRTTSASPTSEPPSSPHSSLQQPPINIDPSSSNSSESSSSIDSTMSNRPMQTEQSLPQSVNSSKAESTVTSSKTSDSYTFRARPVPASVMEPIVSPKMSKAAMLRLGLPWTPPVRATASRNSTPSNNPPVKSAIAPVASLNPPSVQPRPTKASALRTGAGPSASPPSDAARPKRTESEIFENTPGHGFRRANLQTNIASIAAPKTLPRPNKASALRGAGMGTPPSTSSNAQNGQKPSGQSANRRSVDYQGVPGHKRAEKMHVEATRRPEIEPRMTKASMLRMNGSSNGAKPVVRRSSGRPHGRPLAASKSRQSSHSSSVGAAASYTSDPSDEPDEILALDVHAATLPLDLHHIPRSPAKPLPNDDFGCAIIRHP